MVYYPIWVRTSTADENLKKHYISSDKTSINHGKTHIKSGFTTN